MKYVMAALALMIGACGNNKNDRPPATAAEPVSTTQTTSATTIYQSDPVAADNAPAPIVAVKESDQSLATKVRASLGRDKALQSVPWQRVSMVVEDQHVTLRGHLPTVADSTEVERVVRETKGVRAVTNEIHANDANQN